MRKIIWPLITYCIHSDVFKQKNLLLRKIFSCEIESWIKFWEIKTLYFSGQIQSWVTFCSHSHIFENKKLLLKKILFQMKLSPGSLFVTFLAILRNKIMKLNFASLNSFVLKFWEIKISRKMTKSDPGLSFQFHSSKIFFR